MNAEYKLPWVKTKRIYDEKYHAYTWDASCLPEHCPICCSSLDWEEVEKMESDFDEEINEELFDEISFWYEKGSCVNRLCNHVEYLEVIVYPEKIQSK